MCNCEIPLDIAPPIDGRRPMQSGDAVLAEGDAAATAGSAGDLDVVGPRFGPVCMNTGAGSRLSCFFARLARCAGWDTAGASRRYVAQ